MKELLTEENRILTDKLIDGILKKDRFSLSKAITIIESTSYEHKQIANYILDKINPFTGNSIRIGISGSPGVGKSTFIESFGLYLCNNNYKVAVLAVDPSSKKTKGSILGDKTRMENLSRHKNSFIRPSPSSGYLGGTTRTTHESIMLCEASGYNVIIVETVGIGQSEISVRSMVDIFMLLLQPTAGDELQGLKKGAVEIADLIVINKADGDNLNNAKITLKAYENAIHYLQPATTGWQTKILLSSAIKNQGIEEIWNQIQRFLEITKENDIFYQRREQQKIDWVYSIIENLLLEKFYNNPKYLKIKDNIENHLRKNKITPYEAINKFLKTIQS